ncbi:MAG: DUF3006 family protein [Elusimicrobiota bacterium]
MRAVIDRIEDGKIVVLTIIGGGEMLIPAKQFKKFKIHEGMWLDIEFKPNREAEDKARQKVIKLQQELLKK